MNIKILFVTIGAFLVYDTFSNAPCQNMIYKTTLDSILTDSIPEIQVLANSINNLKDRDIYYITNKQQKETPILIDLIDNLPHFTYNRIKKNISFKMDSRIAYQINNIESTFEDIQSLPSNRVQHIEVIHFPKGRNSLSECKYIINIKLKNGYIGQDFIISNFSILDIGKNNGQDFLINEQPSLQYDYTNQKWNFDVKYGYGMINWNLPYSYEKSYLNNNLEYISDKYTSDNPNEHNSINAYYIKTGLDYQFNPKSRLSFRSLYSSNKEKNEHYFTFTEYPTELVQNEHITTNEKKGDSRFSLTFQQEINNKLVLQTSINYNYVRISTNSTYQLMPSLTYKSHFGDYKHFTNWFIDLSHKYNNSSILNYGYIGTWKKYKAHETSYKGIVNKHYKIYSYWDYTISSKSGILIGTSIDYIRQQNHRKKNIWKILPSLRINYSPIKHITFLGSYNTSISYPTIYQLSSNTYPKDILMYHKGNSNLKVAEKHFISFQGSFWDNLIIEGNIEIGLNTPVPLFTNGEDKFYQSYTNAIIKSANLYIGYNWKIASNLHWDNMIQYRYDEISYKNNQNACENWGITSKINYYLNNLNMQASLEYDKGMYKIPTIQGYNDIGQDIWQLTLQKSILRNRAYITFCYVLPIKLGISQRQKNITNTDFYMERTYLDMSTYNNLVLIRVQINLHKGINIKKNLIKSTFENETKKNRGLIY